MYQCLYACREAAEGHYEEVLASMEEAQSHAELAQQGMARLQQLQEQRDARSAAAAREAIGAAEIGAGKDAQTVAEGSESVSDRPPCVLGCVPRMVGRMMEGCFCMAQDCTGQGMA